MNKTYSEKLKVLVRGFGQKLLNLDEASFHKKDNPEKWSKKEILGHLIDSAYNNHQRFTRAWDKDNLIFHGYDQDAWVKKNNYQERSAKEVVYLFLAVNSHMADLIAGLDENLLTKMTTDHNFDKIGMRPIEKGSPSSLGYLIDDYIFHLQHHLNQILDIPKCE